MLAVLLALSLGQIVGPLHIEEEKDGPQIIFASTRGQVFYCDFSSPVCSDGRVITTTRSTPVPCEVSPGVWETVGVDEGCYSVRGLESWAANTSYLAYGADLTNTAWIKQTGMSVEKVGSVYRIRRNRGDTGAAFVHQEIAAVTQQETWTAACVMRAGTATVARLSVHRSSAATVVNLTSEWQVFANTKTLEEGQIPGVNIGPAFTAGDSYIEVAGCWLTKGDTPGRPCWGGEAPVTCAGDQHTISTEGWPTESGSISVAFKFEEFSEAFSIILDARTSASSGFNIHYDRSDGRLVHRQGSRLLRGPTVETGKPYFVELRRKGPKVEMLLNGVLVASNDDWPPWNYSPIAVLGKHFDPSNVLYVKGPIRSLTVRSYEEVSP